VPTLVLPWTVTRIGDTEVAEPTKVTIAFDIDKSGVAGSAGCNRYFGSFTLTGEGLSFGPGMGSTMMACEDNAMAAERAFLSAMTTVDRFDIDADGALLLISADAPVMRAQR
jgi:heat shock protein HslJ